MKPGRPRADAAEFEAVAVSIDQIHERFEEMAEELRPKIAESRKLNDYDIYDMARAIRDLAECCARLARR